MNLQADIATVKGVGPKTAAALRQAGIQTVGDLLYLLPRTYENYQTITDIAHLRPGKVMVKGKITNISFQFSLVKIVVAKRLTGIQSYCFIQI